MTENAHQAKRAPDGTGYAKGEKTRDRILAAGISVFGRNGFQGATTRQIADTAGVNLPALQYYFGGKKGLYLACAQMIADRHRGHMAPVGSEVYAKLERDLSPSEARHMLRALFFDLAEFLTGASEQEDWSLFVSREIAQPGEAFDILYEHLWQPGITMAADLIARIHGRRRRTQQDLAQAMMMISSIGPFQSGREVAGRVLGARADSETVLDMVRQALTAQIEQMGRDGDNGK